MKEYIKRFCTSYEEARKLKDEIYSLNTCQSAKDVLWIKIVHRCIDYDLAKWYIQQQLKKG